MNDLWPELRVSQSGVNAKGHRYLIVNACVVESAQNRVNKHRVSWFVNEMVWEIVSPHFSRPCSICLCSFSLSPAAHACIHARKYIRALNAHTSEPQSVCTTVHTFTTAHTNSHTHTMCASSRWMHACRHACKEASVCMFSDVGAFELVHCCVFALSVVYVHTVTTVTRSNKCKEFLYGQ